MSALVARRPRHAAAAPRRTAGRWRRAVTLISATVALVLVGGTAWAYWVASTTVGSAGAAAATSVNPGATPTASATGSTVTVGWAASTLASGQAVAGYEIRRYNATTLAQQTILSACTGVVASLGCVESSVPPGNWRYSVTPVIGTNWKGTESALSPVIYVDATAPVNAISVSNVTGGAAKVGNTVYYRGVAAGSFTLTNAVTDAISGPASSQTAALGGTTTGWSHTASTVSTPAAGPYVSGTFSWAAATTSSPTEVVTGRDVAGNTAATTLTFTNDSTAPTAGTIAYTNGYQPGRSVTVTFTTGTDAAAGIVTRQLQRSQAPLTNGTCGTTYSSFVDIGSTSPTSPYFDTEVVNAVCYKYRYVVTDAVGNQRIMTSANIARIDYAGALAMTTGLLSQWRLGEASGTVADDVSTTNNNGTYVNTPTLNVTGALPNDSNTAVQFDGVNEYATVVRQIASDFSIEFWMKSSQNFGTGCTQWWQGAGLVDAEMNGAFRDFGVTLCGGKILAGYGAPDVTVVSPSAYNDNTWHHVVFTRTQATGALALYIDGALVGTATAHTQPLDEPANLNFGRVQSGVNYFAGVLDEVAVYTSVLSPTTVTNHYELGSSTASDIAGPTGGSVDASGLVGTGSRYSTSPTLSIVFSPGTDPSGLLTSGATLQRASATLTTGTCGTFGSYALVSGGTDPVSPKSDTVTTGSCYRYQYTVSDTFGNPTTYTSGDIKVDSTVPSTPTLAISSPVNSYWNAGASTLFYNSGSASGSFVVTGSSTDAQAGIASYSYPAAGTNWTSTPGALGVNTYSWSGAPAAPGTLNVTSTSNASVSSASAPITFVADNTAPSAGTISYRNGVYTGTTVTVTFTTGTDAGSGIATRLLQRATATLTGTTCGTFGAFATVTNGTNPTSPLVNTVNASGACYMYRYVVTDNVGNQHIATSTDVVRSPGAIWAFNATSGTSAVDSSGNSRTATLAAGATPFNPGRVGTRALGLNGTTGYASHASPAVDTSDSYTVAAWVYLDVLTDWQTFASIDGVANSPFYLQYSGGFLRFAQQSADSNTSYAVSVTGPAPAINTWYHVAGVYNKTAGTIELFVNGVSQGTATALPGWTAFGDTVVGAAKWDGNRTNFTDGRLDDVRFYGRVLTPAEIQALAAM